MVYKVANQALGVPSSISKEELYEIAKRKESPSLPEVPKIAIDKLNKNDLVILGELFSELDTILKQGFGLPEEEVFSHQQFLEDREFKGNLLFIGVTSSSLLLAPYVTESNGTWGLGRDNSARELSTLNDEQVSSLLLSYFMARFDREGVPCEIVVDREQKLPFSTRINIINRSLDAFGECQAMIDMDNWDDFLPEGFDFEALKAKLSALKLEERFLLNRVFKDIHALCKSQKRTRDLLLQIAEEQADKGPTEDYIRFGTGFGSFSISVACRSADNGGWKIGQHDGEITTINATEINLLCTLYTLSELEEPPLQKPKELKDEEEPFISGFSFPVL